MGEESGACLSVTQGEERGFETGARSLNASGGIKYMNQKSGGSNQGTKCVRAEATVRAIQTSLWVLWRWSTPQEPRTRTAGQK